MRGMNDTKPDCRSMIFGEMYKINHFNIMIKQFIQSNTTYNYLYIAGNMFRS